WLTLLMATRLNAQPYGLVTRPEVGPFLNNTMPPAAPSIPTDWSAVVAFTNLVFTNALGLTPVPGTTQLCVWEREGRAYLFENSPSAKTKSLLLDIHNQCQGWDDAGFLGLAFHPGFQTNRFVFAYYTWVAPGTVFGSPTERAPEYAPGKYHD